MNLGYPLRCQLAAKRSEIFRSGRSGLSRQIGGTCVGGVVQSQFGDFPEPQRKPLPAAENDGEEREEIRHHHTQGMDRITARGDSGTIEKLISY